MKNLPIDYVKRMKELLGDEYPLYEKALNEPPVKAIRVNTDKISLEDFEKLNIFGTEKIPYVKNGFYLEYEKVGNHPYHHVRRILPYRLFLRQSRPVLRSLPALR